MSSQILNVPEYQEAIEIGEKGSSIHPPKLVEGPSDEGLRKRTGELKYLLPQYSIYSLPEQIRRGEQPRLGGKPIGFVPYQGPTTTTGGSPRNPGFDLYLPIGGGMAITQMTAWYVPDQSPEGHSMVQVMLDLWKAKYGTAFYNIDTVTGQVYISKDGEITAIPEKCSFKPIVGTEIMSTTPIRGLGMGKLVVETPESPLGPPGMPPAAESTKKVGLKRYPVDLGESFVSSKDREITQSSKFTPESKAGTPDSEEHPSLLHPGPIPGSLGGGPEPHVSSPENEEEIWQHKEQERRVAKQLAEEAKQAGLIAEERRKAEEALLAEERQKAQEQERARQQAQALALQREEEAKRQEQENKLRQQEMQRLLKEKERIRYDRMSILTSQLALLIQRKKDLREELLNKRDEQVKTGQETDEIRQIRRDELQDKYRKYAEQVVDPVLDYWDLDEHTPENACTLPIDDLEDYDVTYKMGHKWSERELMKLRFNLEEIKLEPRYWEVAQGIRNMMFPHETRETREIYRKVKQDWEQKYATGVQWQTIAESAIQQQIERLRLDKDLQQKKTESDNKRPAVVAPPEVGKEKRPPREGYQRTSVEKEADKARRVGGPGKPGTPDQEQMDRERQEAVKAAANITRGVNGNQKVIKSKDEKSPQGTPPTKNNQGRMGSVHAPTFVPRETGQAGPRGTNGRVLPPPPYQYEKRWFCDNCQNSHGRPICPCPICNVVGHIYYLCPHRDEKESRGVVPDQNWEPPVRVCEICGTEHAGPCTLGQKQNPQIQAMLATRQSREWSNDNSLGRDNVKTRGATPYCMHCGYKDNLHDPNCPVVREKAMYFQCSFCGDIGHPSDNCAARLQALQEQQKGYLCSYCGAADHTSENCSKLRENIAREKADINQRNIEKYEASKQHTAKGQENSYQTQQGKADSEGQSKQVPIQLPPPGGPHTRPGGMGGTGGGGQPP